MENGPLIVLGDGRGVREQDPVPPGLRVGGFGASQKEQDRQGNGSVEPPTRAK